MRDLPNLESTSRVCTLDDVPWVLSLAYRRYTKPFDPGTCLTWLVQVLKSPQALTLRSDHAFLAAIINILPWWPDEPECDIALLVAAKGHHWEAIRLLRESIAWARGKGCARWRLWSETDYDFEMLARRVGATPGAVKYQIDLREDADGRTR